MQVETAPPVVKRPSVLKFAVHLVLLLGLLGVFAWQAHKNWNQIAGYQWSSMHWGLATGALVLLLVCTWFDIFIWNRTLGWFTDPLPFHQAAPIYIWSYLARYVPGKVFSLALRAGLAAEVGRGTVPVLASSTVELALRTASACLMFILLALFSVISALKDDVNPQVTVICAMGIIPLVLVCAHPRIMLPVTNWVLRKMKKAPIERALRYRDVLGVFLLLLTRWMVYGLAFALFLHAVHPTISLALVPVLIGVAAGSWAVGFVIPAPAGTGVTETFLLPILTFLHFPYAIALVFPWLFRLLTLTGEGLWALVGWALRARWQRRISSADGV
ncbi:MAG: lysylphosphatidylglycerol synthase transmembrane domain-containing protein [Armatimonadota bacterium]